ncbi:MAG TPA: Wzz/FepE/Etk N-terminal domain-containing protein, partial [Luteimonas sp.]|nr:Wzz/FepE/Etk N-terminal domain-containing protein [Luteimonas sp.]
MATHLATKMATYAPSVRDNEIDLRSLLATLGEHKRLILLGTAVFLALSVLYVVLATPEYEANAVVQVEKKTPLVPGIGANAEAPSQSDDAAASTEIQLLTSRQVLGEALSDLGLDVRIEPAHFPVFGNFIARQFQPSQPGGVASPWFGLDRYGWGGEALQFSRLDVPDELTDVPMELVAGSGGNYSLYDGDGNRLLDGHVGEVASSNGITSLVRTLRANPGMHFKVTRLNSLVILDQMKDDITAVEQGRDSGVIALRYSNADPILAKRVLENISNTYVHQNVARNSAEAAKRLTFVKAQLPKVRQELEKAQNALTEFQSRTQTLDVGVQNKA